MQQTLRDNIPLATILLAPFRERFLMNGNVYDMNNQSRFSVEEKETLKNQHHHILTNTKLYDFARNAYVDHPGEDAFRKYIGVPLPCEKVRKQLSLCTPRGHREPQKGIWQHVAIFFTKLVFLIIL